MCEIERALRHFPFGTLDASTFHQSTTKTDRMVLQCDLLSYGCDSAAMLSFGSGGGGGGGSAGSAIDFASNASNFYVDLDTNLFGYYGNNWQRYKRFGRHNNGLS